MIRGTLIAFTFTGLFALTLLVLAGCGKDSAPTAVGPQTYTLSVLYDKTNQSDTATGYAVTYTPTATVAWGSDSLQLENHVPQTLQFLPGTVLTSHFRQHIVNPIATPPKDTVLDIFSTLTLRSNAVWRF